MPVGHVSIAADVLQFKILFAFHTLPHAVVVVVGEDAFLFKLTVSHQTG